MSPRSVLATALGAAAVAAAQITSPQFILSSTALLDLPTLPSEPTISDIHHTLWGAFSSCPTKHYAIVEQPGVSHADFASVYLPVSSNVRTTISTQNITGGYADTIAIINTILMDCLHKGVGHVEPLDTSQAGTMGVDLPKLTQEEIDDRVMWIPLPELSESDTEMGRQALLGRHIGFVQGVIEQYFQGEDYTLVYVTKQRECDKATHEVEAAHEDETPAVKHAGQEDEVPLVFED